MAQQWVDGKCAIHGTLPTKQDVGHGKWIPVCQICEDNRSSQIAKLFSVQSSLGYLKAQHDASSCEMERAIFDVRMEKAMNPKGLPIHVMSVIISADRCPNCLCELDTGYECNACGFDAHPWLTASTAINNANYDKREA